MVLVSTILTRSIFGLDCEAGQTYDVLSQKEILGWTSFGPTLFLVVVLLLTWSLDCILKSLGFDLSLESYVVQFCILVKGLLSPQCFY